MQKELKLGRREVTVCFVDRREIARLNKQFRGKPKPTDVLSFPANGGKQAALAGPSDPNYLGDIAISPDVARQNAKRFGRTIGDELRILVLHGMLHLAGYDHETDQGQMDRIETRLRRKLGLG